MVGIGGKLAPIRVDLAMSVIHLVEDHSYSLGLKDFEGRVCEHVRCWDAERQTTGGGGNRGRTVFPKQFGSFGPHGRFLRLEVRKNVQKILTEGAGIVSRNCELEVLAEDAIARVHKLGL